MDQRFVAALIHAVSPVRMSRYEAYSGIGQPHFLDLYHYNMAISNELFFCLSFFEVVLPNRINWFFIRRYGADWPYADRLRNTLSSRHKTELEETCYRQQEIRQLHIVDAGMVVADLSFGFWVSLFAARYRVPFDWRPDGNLRQIFPNDTPGSLVALHADLDRLRSLRNRIAHHEPILHIDPPRLHATAMALLSAMCRDSADFVAERCRFSQVWAEGPRRWPVG